MYYDMFHDIDDLCAQFEITKDQLEGVRILMAEYTYEDYSGQAYVLFEKDGKLYEVNGSHCSCYGLEKQWQPEETDKVALIHRITKGTLGYDSDSGRDVFAGRLLSSLTLIGKYK
jgi:hypothetical protein